MRTKLAIWLALSLAPMTMAQIVVDPNGSGQYTDLQPALDAAADGSVIKVIGGSYGSIVIRKSVTIVGAPQPSIASPYVGTGDQPDAISLQGAGSGVVALVNLYIVNRASYASWNRGGAPIGGFGFDELRVIDCTVTAPWAESVTGNISFAVPGIGTSVARVVVVRSTVTGGETYACPGSTWPVDGGAGISAPRSLVTVVDSVVVGGRVADFVSWPYPPTNQPCPCPFSGVGGVGVDAATLVHSGSTLLGGSGARVWHSSSINRWPQFPWGKQPDGSPYRATSALAALSLIVPSPAKLGNNFTVSLWAPMRTGGLVLVGAPGVPVSLPEGYLYIDPQALYATFALASTSGWFSLPIPNNPALGGFPFALQHLDLTLGLSRPALEVVRF